MARKSRKQTAAPMPAPSLYVHVALYIRLSVEDNKKRGCSVENQKLVLNDFLSDKPDFVVYDTYIDNGATGTNFHRPGSVKKAKQLQNVPTHQTFSKVKCSVLIVAEAFTGNAPSAGKDLTLTGSTALQTAG